MEESRSNNGGLGEGIIKKGPWKPEEDQVLLSHVRKYGPRDWSSIRSKGLLHRTGKSCRLRWVNKLRPNLKNGCKFTLEEERTVIELQAQLGNKWATIATHLPGRTDNDVKNFWSSRQKRLARILQHSPNLNNDKSRKASSCSTVVTQTDASSSLQGTDISSGVMEGETFPKRLRTTDISSGVMEGETFPKRLRTSSCSFYPSYSIEPLPMERYPETNDLSNNEIHFSSFPNFQTDLALPPETQGLVDRINSSFLEPFGYSYEPALLDDGFQFMPFLGGESSGQVGGNGSNDNPIAPDSFFDDFPADMFDENEPLPSPTRW